MSTAKWQNIAGSKNFFTGKAIFDKKKSCRYRASQIEMDKVNWL